MDYLVVQRGSGKIIVYLRKDNPPPGLPYELQGTMSQDTWASRVDAVWRSCERYSYPIIERFWFAVALITMFAVPIVVSNVIWRNLYFSDTPHHDWYNIRWIGFGIFVGTVILFWTPLLLWKWFGKRQIQKLLQEWENLDRVARPNTFVPHWQVSTPGIFTSQATLRITTPPAPVMTSFHPNAPLPPYIAPAFYPQGAPYPQQPYGYGGGPGLNSDEKKSMEEVKV